MNEELNIEEVAPWLVIFITLGGGILRILLLARNGMWLDETFSVWLANHSVGDMLQWIVEIDQHPPLYYIILHYWIKLYGDTPYYVRLLSVLFGVATIPIIYLIGKRMSGVMLGLVAAILFAISPFNIRFAQETRMYTLLTLNAAVAIYALVRLLTDSHSVKPIGSQFREFLRVWRTSEAVESDSGEAFGYGGENSEIRYRTRWSAWVSRHRWPPIQSIETDLTWVGLIIFSAAALYSHNTAVFFLLAINSFVLGLMIFQRTRTPGSLPAFQAPSFSNWVKSQIAIFLLWVPWIRAFIQQVSRVYQEFWIPKPDWETVIEAIKSLLNFSTLDQPSEILAIWILYLLVLCLGVYYFRKKISRFLFLAILFVVPLLGELIVSIRRPIFSDRTLIWLSIPLLLILAAGIVQLKYRFLIIAGIGIFGTINLFFAGDYYRFFQKEDWVIPAGYVANFAEKDDLVLFNSNFVVIPFNYYFVDYENLYSIQVEKRGIPADLFDSRILEPIMSESDIPGLLSLINGHNRVWLVYSHDWYTDPMGLIPQTLASQMELIRQRNFYGGQVQLYETP